MGIVNLTPDSFYDGGQHHDAVAGVAHAHQLLEEGADILDLGAESSRPGAAAVTAEQEQARLLPVLRALASPANTTPNSFHLDSATPDSFTSNSPTSGSAPTTKDEAAQKKISQPPLLSVDTYHASTAKAALEAGAHIINDISACLWDPALLDVVAQHKPGYVLMHSQGQPQTMQKAPRYTHVVDEVLAFWEQHLQRLTAAGLPESHIVLDPGIGFGKRLEHNMDLLRHMDRLLTLGRPVLMGLSMKSLFANFFTMQGSTPEALLVRSHGTQTATAILAARGVTLHRVHHVSETRRTLELVHALIA